MKQLKCTKCNAIYDSDISQDLDGDKFHWFGEYSLKYGTLFCGGQFVGSPMAKYFWKIQMWYYLKVHWKFETLIWKLKGSKND